MKRKDFIKKSGYFSLLPFGLPISLNFLSGNKKNNETIIVGTGYGASVTAYRLSQKGIPVLMLEMGMNWNISNIPFSKITNPNKYSTWLKNKPIAPFGNTFFFHEKFTGVLDRLDFKEMKVYVGRGVGGGSIVNGGIAATPLKSDFESAFPQINSNNFYNKYFPRAEEMLKVNIIDNDFYQKTPYYHFSRIGQKQAEEAGYITRIIPNVYDFKYMEQESQNKVPKSALDREVIYGNNYGKNTLNKTYLKRALKTGLVTILPLHKVNSIKNTSNGNYELGVNEINTYGKVINLKKMQCRNLFLCAGSIGTTSLLIKSQAYGLLNNLNKKVGKNWCNNGNIMTGRNFVDGGAGRKQSTIPVASIDNRNDKYNYFLSEIAPLPINRETWTTLYLMLTKIKNDGFFFFDKRNKKVELHWNKENAIKLRKKADSFIKNMNINNGGTRSHLLFKNGIGENICYHPLGGCVLGLGTDNIGRVKGYDNFYVVDSALISGTLGANPFLTITALAEYCVEKIIEQDFS